MAKRNADVDATNIEGFNALHLACKSKNLEAVNVLLELGATVDARTPEEFTAVHLAVQAGELDIVQALVHWAKKSLTDTERFCNFFKTPDEDVSLISVAVAKGNEGVVDYLVEIGIDNGKKKNNKIGAPATRDSRWGKICYNEIYDKEISNLAILSTRNLNSSLITYVTGELENEKKYIIAKSSRNIIEKEVHIYG